MKKIVIYIILTLVVLGLIYFLNEKMKQNKVLNYKLKQNELAYNDTLRVLKRNDSVLTTQKYLYISNNTELKDRNIHLYNEMMFWKEKKQKVEFISEVGVQYKQKKLILDNTLIDLDSNFKGLAFVDSTYEYYIKGMSTFKITNKDSTLHIKSGKTIITDNVVNIDLIVGIKSNNEYKEIFVTSKNPNININKLEGHIIDNLKDKKQNRLGLGTYFGYGLGLYKQQIVLTPQLGLGITYKLK